MSAGAGFGFQTERPKFSSRFGASKQSQNANREPLRDISNTNEIGFGHERMQSRQPMQQQQFQQFPQQQYHHQTQQQQMFSFNPRRDDHFGPVEKMGLPDPPPKFKGYEFVPSNEVCFDDEIELEPLVYRGETNWF